MTWTQPSGTSAEHHPLHTMIKRDGRLTGRKRETNKEPPVVHSHNDGPGASNTNIPQEGSKRETRRANPSARPHYDTHQIQKWIDQKWIGRKWIGRNWPNWHLPGVGAPGQRGSSRGSSQRNWRSVVCRDQSGFVSQLAKARSREEIPLMQRGWNNGGIPCSHVPLRGLSPWPGWRGSPLS